MVYLPIATQHLYRVSHDCCSCLGWMIQSRLPWPVSYMHFRVTHISFIIRQLWYLAQVKILTLLNPHVQTVRHTLWLRYVFINEACVCVCVSLSPSLPLSLSSLGFPMPFVCAKLLPFCCCNCNWNCKVSLLQHACHRRRRSLSSLRARFGIGFVKVNCMQYCAFFSLPSASCLLFTLSLSPPLSLSLFPRHLCSSTC